MKDYEIITTDWNGIKLEIRWMPNYRNCSRGWQKGLARGAAR